MKASRCLAALLALGAFGVLTATAMDGMDRHGCRYRGQYETDCSNDITEKFNENSSDPVCLNETVNFLVPVELTDEGAHNQKVIVYRHPEVCPPLYIDQYIAPVVPEYTWTIWCQKKIVAQGSGPAASCQGVTNKEYKCRFVTRLDRKCAPPATTSWVSRTVTKLDLWGVWTNVFLGTNLQLHAEGAPPYYWKSRDTEIADVDQEGLVTGVKTGKTTIMVWDANGCYADVLVKVLDMALVPDVNRDRAIGDDDRDKITEENPYRIWINDDQDLGDVSEGEQDIPGAGEKANCRQGWVSGRCDLLDFFPLWLDVKQVVDEIHEGDGVIIKLSQGDIAVKAVYTDLMRNKAGRYQIADVASCGPQLDQKSFEAEVFAVYASGTALAESFLSRIRLEREKGVLLVEGTKKTTSPLRLEVWKGGTLLGRRELALSVDGVEEMYRWINLRHVTGGREARHTEDGVPSNYPDSICNGKQFVFVHGFNTTEAGARGWNAEVFKRLFQSGSCAMFTAVTWEGDETPGVLTPGAYYHADVINAFQAAPALASSMAALPGQKYLAAHSLGNMVASSAIIDHRLNLARYFMIDAAVAMEAYKATARHPLEIEESPWPSYTNRVWAADWYKLFDEPDGRYYLTWRARFGNISRAINYYSSGEDVLNNNDPPRNMHLPATEKAWIFQEKVKGGILPTVLVGVDSHGGWGFNGAYSRGVYDPSNGVFVKATTPDEAALLPDYLLRTQSFFKRFYDKALYGPGGSALAAEPNVRGKILAEAIPASSRATGRNEVEDFFAANVDLMTLKTGWPRSNENWHHSDFKNVAFLYVHQFFGDMVAEGDL